MRIPRIYTDQELLPGSLVTLNDFSSRHLCQVLRCRAGQPLVLFNGRGGEYQATIEEPGKSACTLRVGDFTSLNRESPLHIHLGLALSKGDRFDWALQKCAELGVASIVPLITERTEWRLEPKRQEKKMQHWERLLISSCEQSQRNILPRLHSPETLSNWLSLERSHPAYILHPGAEPLGGAERPTDLSLAVGPEGGFAEGECEAALESGFQILSLGPRILRTETAPVAALSVLQWIWGDLREG